MIPFEECTSEVAFSFVNRVDKRVVHIAVQRLVAFLNEECTSRLINIRLDQKGYDHVTAHGGLEVHRLNRIFGDIREPIVYVDIDSAAMEDGSTQRCQQLVDGNHRYVRAWEQGQRSLKGWVTPEPVWRHFEIEFPDDLREIMNNPVALEKYNRSGFSGIV